MSDLQTAYQQALSGQPSKRPLIEMVRRSNNKILTISITFSYLSIRLFHLHWIQL